MAKRFDQKTKDRVIRLAEDKVLLEGLSLQKACLEVAPQFGVSHHTVRQWVQQARREGRAVYTKEELLAMYEQLKQEQQALLEERERILASSPFFTSSTD